MAFVLRELSQLFRRGQFDAEDVFDLSSPYKGTAERSSAAKKPHMKMEKPVDFFDGFQPISMCFKASVNSNYSLVRLLLCAN